MKHKNLKRDALGQTQRQRRVGEEVRHVLAGVMARFEYSDQLLNNTSVTVSEVRVSPDLRHAKVFIMPLGGLDIDAVLVALGRDEVRIRHEMAKGLHIKYLPKLRFFADDSYSVAQKIEALLKKPEVQKDLLNHS